MPVAPAQACPMRSLSACGNVFGHSLSIRCRYLSRRHAAAVSALVLSRVHWVRPEMVVEVSFAEWTPDGLLRHVVYLGEREDKPSCWSGETRPDRCWL
jgi:ATP-dependent DNA ligase